MEKIRVETGKPIPECDSFLNVQEDEKCTECGEVGGIVYNCPFCGAPVCCHKCGCSGLQYEGE